MKTKLLIAFWIVLGIFSNAQTNLFSTNSQTLPGNAVVEDNSLQNIFANLDKSKIETGLLLDAAIESIDLKKYDGTMPDSNPLIS